MGIQKVLFAVLSVVVLASSVHAVDPPPIDSHLFQSGELIYTDGLLRKHGKYGGVDAY